MSEYGGAVFNRLKQLVLYEIWPEDILETPAWLRVFVVFFALPLVLISHFLFVLIQSRGAQILVPELELSVLLPLLIFASALAGKWLVNTQITPKMRTDRTARPSPNARLRRAGQWMWAGGIAVVLTAFVLGYTFPEYPRELLPVICIPPSFLVCFGVYLVLRRRP